MTTSDTRRYEMLVRVSGFGEANRELFPPESLGGQAFATVTEAVRQLQAHRMTTVTTQKGGRQAKVTARDVLMAQMEVVSRSARGIALTQPGFDEVFQLPRTRSDQAYLTAGRVFVQEAEVGKAQFVRYGLAEDFVANLTRLVDEFERATRAQQVARDKQARARADIRTAFETALAALQTLDTIVPNRLMKDATTRAVWEQDRRVEYARRRRVSATRPQPTPVGGAASTNPAAPSIPLVTAEPAS